MIYGIVGLPGSGKTCYGTWLLRRGRMSGRNCAANFSSTSGEWACVNWDEAKELGNALIVVDEAQMWFSSRNWTKTTQADLGVFQQHRKNGLDLYWIAQHENRVDAALRELTAFVYRVRKVGHALLLAGVDPTDPKKVVSRRFAWMTPEDYAAFDTLELIGDRDGQGRRRGQAARPALWRLAVGSHVWLVKDAEMDEVYSRLCSLYGFSEVEVAPVK